MAIQNYPVWSVEPNWSDKLTQTLEWLTDIMTSPTGAEQRRAVRQFPRRSYEYEVLAAGAERSYLDNMLVTYGSSRWYVPLWHEVDFLTDQVFVGATFLPCDTSVMRVEEGDVIYLAEEDLFSGELAEVAAVSEAGIILSSPITAGRSVETRIYGTAIARLSEQPSFKKRTDSVVSTRVRFGMVGPASRFASTGVVLDQYLGFPVLDTPPDESDDLTNTYERMLQEMDNKVASPVWADTAQRAFSILQYVWFLEGREQHRQFEQMFIQLRGQAYPLWLPTFMQDFVPAEAFSGSSTAVKVERSGFTEAGGPRPEREYIRIETMSAVFYRRITLAGLDSEKKEILVLDSVLGEDIQKDEIVRISFMVLARLNQDSIQIEHETDNTGVSSVSVNFRSAPDLRTVATGF